MLYDRYATRLYSLAIHILADADQAEEVVEDVFWQAWQTASHREPSGVSVATWLPMIVRRRAVGRLRARERYPAEVLPDEELPGAAVMELVREDTPLEQPAVWKHRQSVMEALNKLSPEQRGVIELAFFRGLTQSQIVQHSGRPLGTIKSQVCLGMTKLRDQLIVLREGEV